MLKFLQRFVKPKPVSENQDVEVQKEAPAPVYSTKLRVEPIFEGVKFYHGTELVGAIGGEVTDDEIRARARTIEKKLGL